MDSEQKTIAGLFVTAIVVIIGLVIIFGSFGIVQQKEVGVKTRLGKVVGTVDAGLYFKVPFMEKVTKIDMKTRTVKNEHYVNEEGEIESNNPNDAASKDQQEVKVSTVINYKIQPDKAVEIFTRYGDEENFEESVLKPVFKQEVKDATSFYTAEELVTKRAEYNDRIFTGITTVAAEKGVIIEETSVTNIEFSESYTKAIEEKVTAQQNALKAENDLVRVKFESEQRITEAQAEAEAIKIQSQAINSQGGASYVEMKKVEKWNGAGCTQYCGVEASTGLLISR